MFNAAKLKFDDIFENRLSQFEIREYLLELYERGETAAEIAGAASAMRDHLIPLPIHEDLKEKLIDNCGTGGDGSNSFNISAIFALEISFPIFLILSFNSFFDSVILSNFLSILPPPPAFLTGNPFSCTNS